MLRVCERHPGTGEEDQPLCEAFADVLVGQIYQNLTEEKISQCWDLWTQYELIHLDGVRL